MLVVMNIISWMNSQSVDYPWDDESRSLWVMAVPTCSPKQTQNTCSSSMVEGKDCLCMHSKLTGRSVCHDGTNIWCDTIKVCGRDLILQGFTRDVIE